MKLYILFKVDHSIFKTKRNPNAKEWCCIKSKITCKVKVTLWRTDTCLFYWYPTFVETTWRSSSYFEVWNFFIYFVQLNPSMTKIRLSLKWNYGEKSVLWKGQNHRTSQKWDLCWISFSCEQSVQNFPVSKSAAVSILIISHPNECTANSTHFNRVRIQSGRKQHILQEK